MKAESGEEEFESEEGEELAMEEEEQANKGEWEANKGEGEANKGEGEANKGEGEANKGEEEANKGEEKVQEGEQDKPRTIITDEMRATVIDHVIVHGMTMAEAGLRVRPNLSRFTVATIIRAFRQHNRYCTLLLSLSQYNFTSLWK